MLPPFVESLLHGNLKSVCCSIHKWKRKHDCKLDIKKLNAVYFQAVSQNHIDRNVIAMQTHRSKQFSKPSMNTESSIGGKIMEEERIKKKYKQKQQQQQCRMEKAIWTKKKKKVNDKIKWGIPFARENECIPSGNWLVRACWCLFSACNSVNDISFGCSLLFVATFDYPIKLYIINIGRLWWCL